jgi:hypothetical protein
MAIELSGHEREVPLGLPQPRVRVSPRVAVVVAGLVAGILIGWLAYVTVGDDAATRVARAQDIQQARADAMVQAYEADWARIQPSGSRIAVTGTGPGLAWVAEQQADWAENVITGTGPGLVTVANMQAGYGTTGEPTGTGPGLIHLREPAGPEVAVIGTP